MERRIVVISEDFSPPWDEGIKKYAWSLGNALRAWGNVSLLNVDRSGTGNGDETYRIPGSRTYARPAVVRAIRRADPDVIAYVPSPSSTLSSFARSWSLRRIAPRARVGMIALIPRRHGGIRRPLVRALSPHRVFVPSNRSLVHLNDLGVPGTLVSMGIDTRTFSRANRAQRASLRARYGIAQDSFVFLHVGHLRPRRALGVMARLAGENGASALVVSSTSTPEDPDVRAELERAGVRIIREYIPIHEVYVLSDCYVFPVVDPEGSVEIPLSVIEALAAGLPVISRPFGGLRDHLPAGPDLRYFDTGDELVAHARAVRSEGGVAVRDMQKFSWANVAGEFLNALEGAS